MPQISRHDHGTFTALPVGADTFTILLEFPRRSLALRFVERLTEIGDEIVRMLDAD